MGVNFINSGSQAYAPATHPALTVEWSAMGGQSPRVWFEPFVQKTEGRPNATWSWPRVHCSNTTTLTAAETVCTQPLACGSYSTALKTDVKAASGPSGQQSGRATVGIGNKQATYQYPSLARESQDSERDAVQAARDAMAVTAASLLAGHELWWAGWWNSSALVSVPHMRTEAFYAIQTFKLGASYREEGVPIIDQQGPVNHKIITPLPFFKMAPKIVI